MNESEPKGQYNVAFKLFLRDNEKLLITHDIFGAWDLPGGRMKDFEFDKPIESIIRRKVDEELGEAVQYNLGDFITTFRVERLEATTQKIVRIVALGYEADYRDGKLQMGNHHDKQEWVDVSSFKPEEYFEGGWLIGVQEYMKQIKNRPKK